MIIRVQNREPTIVLPVRDFKSSGQSPSTGHRALASLASLTGRCLAHAVGMPAPRLPLMCLRAKRNFPHLLQSIPHLQQRLDNLG